MFRGGLGLSRSLSYGFIARWRQQENHLKQARYLICVTGGDRLREASGKFQPRPCRDFPDGNKIRMDGLWQRDVYYGFFALSLQLFYCVSSAGFRAKKHWSSTVEIRLPGPRWQVPKKMRGSTVSVLSTIPPRTTRLLLRPAASWDAMSVFSDMTGNALSNQR